MSYILDALQRSQRERELGEVPTLGSAQYIESAPARAHPGPWILLAVGLGLAALVLALYMVLSREPERVQAAEPVSVSPPTAGPASPPMPTPGPDTSLAPAVPLEQAPVPPRAVSAPPSEAGTRRPVAPPPAPTRPPATDRTAATPPPGRPAPEPPSAPKSASSPEPARVSRPAPTPQSAPVDPQIMAPPVADPDVPTELLNEIEAFKERLKRESHSGMPPARPDPPTAPAEAPQPPAQAPAKPSETPPGDGGAPRFRSLAPRTQEEVPAYRISVHVYSKDPKKRFVIMNSRRMGEGETNRDGLKVESILPKGVVLSHGKTRFLVDR